VNLSGLAESAKREWAIYSVPWLSRENKPASQAGVPVERRAEWNRVLARRVRAFLVPHSGGACEPRAAFALSPTLPDATAPA